jgi:hypothetical protein
MNLSTGSFKTIRPDLGQLITTPHRLKTLEIGTDACSANPDY